jgi:hypothetical protein
LLPSSYNTPCCFVNKNREIGTVWSVEVATTNDRKTKRENAYPVCLTFNPFFVLPTIRVAQITASVLQSRHSPFVRKVLVQDCK